MAIDDDEMDAAIDEAGEELWFNGVPFSGFFDEADIVIQDTDGMGATTGNASARVPTNRLPSGLAIESDVTRAATGSTYRVRDIRGLPPDSAMSLIVFVKV